MAEDSIEGIYDTLKQCAIISKSAGGIGLSVHKIRATGRLPPFPVSLSTMSVCVCLCAMDGFGTTV